MASPETLLLVISNLDFIPYLALLSFEWNSIRLGGPVHGIVTKIVHKTLPVNSRGQGGRGGWVRVIKV